MSKPDVMAFARTDTSRISEWRFTVDFPLIALLSLLMLVGFLMVWAAGPAAAARLSHLNLSEYHFVIRQGVFLTLAIGVIGVVSLADVKEVRRMALGLLVLSIGGVIATLIIGNEINGATRWISLGFATVQPSEFLKPALIIIVAWILAEAKRHEGVPGMILAIALTGACALLVLAQKDLGQTALIAAVLGAQLFISGLPIIFVVAGVVVGGVGLWLAYLYMPHVTSRLDRFINPDSGDTYQIDVARDAFEAGGFFGIGMGEGVIKARLPDAHTDYIFAVVGEEFGALVCFALMGLFLLIILRVFGRLVSESDHFVQLAAGGLVIMFGLQAAINIAVNLNMVPSKGMTLPFVSYGGSSLLALGISMGFLLALTRKRSVRIPHLGSIS